MGGGGLFIRKTAPTKQTATNNNNNNNNTNNNNSSRRGCDSSSNMEVIQCLRRLSVFATYLNKNMERIYFYTENKTNDITTHK